MKKYLKIDFSKRDTISVVCLTIVLVLVLVFGNCFGFVSADDGGYEYCLNKTDYETSSFYVGTLYSSNEKWYPRDNFSYSLYYDLPSLDFSSVSNVDSNFDYSQVKYYMIFSNDGVSVSAYFFYEQPTIYFYGNQYLCQMPSGYTDNCVYYCNIPYVTLGQGDGQGHNYHFEITSSSSITEVNLGQWRDFYLGINNSNFLPMYGNNQFLQITNGWNSEFNNIFDAFEHRLDSGHTNYFVNTNYFVGSALPLNGFDNLEGVESGSDSGETSLNNLYMNNPFWTFSMPSYSSSNRGNIVTNNGSATFNATKTNYQLEHGSDFDLHFTFQITVKYTADGGWSGGSHGFYLLGATDYNALGSTTISRTGTFKYRPSGGSSTYSELSLDHFNGSYSFNTITNYRYIFGNCYLDGDTSKDDFLTWYTRNYNSDDVQFSSIVLKCTAELFDSNLNYSSPCIYQYDFVSGTASMLSDGMGTNNNPYDYQNQDSYTDSVTGSYGYMVQNNNQSVTVTNSNVNSNDISNVIGDIGDDQDSDSLINKFSSLLSLSSWVAVFASAMGFVPVAFWTNLVEYFAVALGILSTFLVLRYILNLLT